MDSISYIYLRGIEWEGNWPEDVGMWARTGSRIALAEGSLSRDHPLSQVSVSGESLPECPKIDADELRARRISFFVPVHSSTKAMNVIDSGLPNVHIGIYLNQSWEDRSGEISAPSVDDQIQPDAHSVVLNDIRHFRQRFGFSNWWEDWGDQHGMGTMPTEYFDIYGYEGQVFVPNQLVQQISTSASDEFKMITWQTERVAGNDHFMIELRSEQDQRIAWLMFTDSHACVNIFELFVIPAYRERNLAISLLDQFRSMFLLGKKELRLSVPYPDAEEFSPRTFPALISIAERLGLNYVEPDSAFDCYVATNTRRGARVPIRMNDLPPRPKSTAVYERTERKQSSHDVAPVPTDEVLNRRQVLARKKSRDGLNASEKLEFSRLQIEAFERLKAERLEFDLASEVELLERSLRDE